MISLFAYLLLTLQASEPVIDLDSPFIEFPMIEPLHDGNTVQSPALVHWQSAFRRFGG
jgi:hypothetical protein